MLFFPDCIFNNHLHHEGMKEDVTLLLFRVVALHTIGPVVPNRVGEYLAIVTETA